MMESANYRLVKTSIEDKKAISDLLGMPEFLMRFEEDPIKAVSYTHLTLPTSDLV